MQQPAGCQGNCLSISRAESAAPQHEQSALITGSNDPIRAVLRREHVMVASRYQLPRGPWHERMGCFFFSF